METSSDGMVEAVWPCKARSGSGSSVSGLAGRRALLSQVVDRGLRENVVGFADDDDLVRNPAASTGVDVDHQEKAKHQTGSKRCRVSETLSQSDRPGRVLKRWHPSDKMVVRQK